MNHSEIEAVLCKYNVPKRTSNEEIFTIFFLILNIFIQVFVFFIFIIFLSIFLKLIIVEVYAEDILTLLQSTVIKK